MITQEQFFRANPILKSHNSASYKQGIVTDLGLEATHNLDMGLYLLVYIVTDLGLEATHNRCYAESISKVIVTDLGLEATHN